MAYKNECVLEAKECNDCGQCEVCDLDPDKICDNCCKCIDGDADFRGIYVDDILDGDVDEDELETEVFEEDVIEEVE